MDPATGGTDDRQIRDGAAGKGDMLGGAGAGAGDRLGPDAAGEEREERRFPRDQHSFAGEEFAVDAGENCHGASEPV